MPAEPQLQEMHAMRFRTLLKWMRGRLGFDLVQGVRYTCIDASGTLAVRTRTHLVNVRHGTCARTHGLEEQLQLVTLSSAKVKKQFTVAFAPELDLRSRSQLIRFIGSAAMLAARESATTSEKAQLPAPPLDLAIVSVPLFGGIDPVTGVSLVPTPRVRFVPLDVPDAR